MEAIRRLGIGIVLAAVAMVPVAGAGDAAAKTAKSALCSSSARTANLKPKPRSLRKTRAKCKPASTGTGSSATPTATTAAVEPPAATPPPADPPADPNCPLSTPGSSIGMSVSDCHLVASDTASNPSPIPFWGSVDCANASRAQQLGSGGDTHVTGDGAPQDDSAYRRMSVIDGDDFYGERCELGKNDNRDGPTVFYREGQRRLTYLSVRLPPNLPMDRLLWQVVMQMKQTQPSGDGGTPVLELDALDGHWVVYNGNQTGTPSDSTQLWSVAAQSGKWTRFAFDVNYSQDPSQGSVHIYVDLNGDGDFGDANEQSPEIHTHTLKYEPGSSHPAAVPAGASLPSHLRVGPYHSPSYDCPASSGGCSVEVDNVQVVAP